MSLSSPPYRSSLHALPISGESFLLCRGQYTVLVDGGYKSNRVGNVLRKHFPGLRHIDIVVCTHADKDHAGGLPSLLQDHSFSFGQVWLPGRWVDVLPELILDPNRFMNGLVRELDELSDQYPDRNYDEVEEEDFAEILSDRVRQERARVADVPTERPRPADDLPGDVPRDRIDRGDEVLNLGVTEPLDEPSWFAELRNHLREPGSSEAAQKAFKWARGAIQYRRNRPKRPLGAALATYWLGLIETAKAIRGIAEAAVKRDLRIRWFDYVAYSKVGVPAGGIPGFLVPINAVEKREPEELGLSYFTRLSPTNEASLVFFAPATMRTPGVLFCGDSPLGDGPKYRNSFLDNRPEPRGPIIATAPHHGSQSNRIAYKHMYRWSYIIAFLRAGGTKKQPGPTFKRLRCALKLCAKCPQRGMPPALVGVEGIMVGHHHGQYFVRGLNCACR
jgi:hypothetical protein